MHPRMSEHRRRIRGELAELVGSAQGFDILRAALLVAAEEYPELDVERELRRNHELGQGAARRAKRLANPFARLDAVRAYLFEELGFRGNADDYDDPRNSFLNEVLDRRTGIPLTLSLLFAEVARAAGFETRGIALPGHFVVGCRLDGRDILVDPYHGAQVITVDDCRQLVIRATGRPSLFRPELLAGATDREVLIRMLRNLKRTHLARDEYGAALTYVERLLAFAPGDTQEVRDRGFLLAHLGRPGAALRDLEAYLSLEPAAPDAAAVRGRLAWLRRRLGRVN